MNNLSVGIIGVGVVGSAIKEVFIEKNINVKTYDKFKPGEGKLEDLMETTFLLLTLPTLYDDSLKCYNKDSIEEIISYLHNHNYKGIVVLKSTVEPGTTRKLQQKYSSLVLVHNPEFLSAKTAIEDFRNQEHIVIGSINKEDTVSKLCLFFKTYWPSATISLCTWEESEGMKIMVNSFYATKIQFFNEIFLFTQTDPNMSYETVKNLMLLNKWISPHHTQVPGHDGKLSYGGMCFPKDTNALLQEMKKRNTEHSVLEAVIQERNKIRNINSTKN